MAEKIDKAEKTEKKAPARPSRAAKTAPKAATAARATKAPAKAAVAARPIARRTVARKRTAAPATGAPEAFTWRRLRRKTKVGVVVSAKMAKTVVVEVGRLREHPLYKKVIRTRKRFAAHDANSEAKAGDLIRIQESRPFSATKRWRVVEVISRAGEAGAAAPRVADVEKMLEAAEGSGELLVREREEKQEAQEPEEQAKE
jgi:small subunit ribosomal protein S17